MANIAHPIHVIVNGRRHPVLYYHVTGMSTQAYIARGGGRIYSRRCPYHFEIAARENLIAKLQKKYRSVEVDNG